MTDFDPRRVRRDEEAQRIAMFRYQVIGPLVERREFERGEVSALVSEIAGATHFCPGRGPVRLSVRTIYAWRKRFLRGGIDALLPGVRGDKGKARVVKETVLDRAIQLRKEVAKRTTETVIDILVREGTIATKSDFHRSTLDRHLDRCGASRRRMKVLGQKRTIKMRFEKFGDLWVGDYHHGPLVKAPSGAVTTAKLGAFIDHTTRYPVAHRYYAAEDMASLRDTLYRAFLRWGPASKVYVDGGAVYKSKQLAFALQRIECTLMHSKPYYSDGRGVIEKWWQPIIAFENEVDARGELLTLHELNVLWEAYCEERYCQRPHAEIGMSPAEAIASVNPKPLDVEVLRRLFHIRETRKVHKKDCCVPVMGVRFLCESFLKGRKVEVVYDPRDLRSIDILYDGERVQRAFPQPVGGPPEPHVEPEEVEQSVDYLGLIRADYDRKLLEHSRPLAYADLEVDEDFGEEQFVAVLRDLAGLRPGKAELREIRRFWSSYGPLPEDLVRIGVEHAMRMHGRGRHSRIYLHALRVLVLSHWRSRPEKGEEQ